jgi:exodeoxyribonuclease V gamma subunit
LLQFFRNPARYLLRHRLGMAFPENHEDLEDDEPFLPDWDEKNTLADRLLPMYLDDASADEIRASAMAGTEYPPGAMGNALLERELQAMETFSQKLKSEIAAPCLQIRKHLPSGSVTKNGP